MVTETDTIKRIIGTDYYITTAGIVLDKYGFERKGYIRSADGYRATFIKTDGKYKTYLIHTLVAKTFLNKPVGRYMVIHKDGNKLNNDVSNLGFKEIKFTSAYHETMGVSCEVRKGAEVYKFHSMKKVYAFLVEQGYTKSYGTMVAQIHKGKAIIGYHIET